MILRKLLCFNLLFIYLYGESICSVFCSFLLLLFLLLTKIFIYFGCMFCVIYMNKWFSDTLYFMEMFFSDVFTLTVLVIFCYINTFSKLHDLKWWPLIHSLVLVFFFMLTEVTMKYSVERWARLYNHSWQVPRWCNPPPDSLKSCLSLMNPCW